MSKKEVMLTTADNPYDPFIQFDEWYAFDEAKGYHTCSYLARIAPTSSELSDEENDRIIEQAMDEIVEFNLTGNYKKIEKTDAKK